MNEIKALLGRLTSRKFLLTVAGLVGVYLKPEIAAPIVTLIGIFVGAEGAADTVERYADKKFPTVEAPTTTPPNSAAEVTPEEEPNFQVIVPGDGGSAAL